MMGEHEFFDKDRYFLEQKLRITDLANRLHLKIVDLEHYVVTHPKLADEIHYHKVDSMIILLGNQWRQLVNTWHNLDSQTTSGENMHGLACIVRQTGASVRATLRSSQRFLDAELAANSELKEGRPPGGIPIKPSRAVKPSSAVGPSGIRNSTITMEGR
jgi:hypothetical protein